MIIITAQYLLRLKKRKAGDHSSAFLVFYIFVIVNECGSLVRI